MKNEKTVSARVVELNQQTDSIMTMFILIMSSTKTDEFAHMIATNFDQAQVKRLMLEAGEHWAKDAPQCIANIMGRFGHAFVGLSGGFSDKPDMADEVIDIAVQVLNGCRPSNPGYKQHRYEPEART